MKETKPYGISKRAVIVLSSKLNDASIVTLFKAVFRF